MNRGEHQIVKICAHKDWKFQATLFILMYKVVLDCSLWKKLERMKNHIKALVSCNHDSTKK